MSMDSNTPRPRGFPWWDPDQLTTALGEVTTIQELANRWGTSDETIHRAIKRHDLPPSEAMPAPGRAARAVIAEFVADGRRHFSSVHIARRSDYDTGEIGPWVRPAVDSLSGVTVEKWSQGSTHVTYQLTVDE